jgi:hypothetical protein
VREGTRLAIGGDGGFDVLVGNEEESCTGSGTGNYTTDSFVDAGPAAVGEETSLRLQTGFEGVEGEEREVYGGAGETTCLGVMSVNGTDRRWSLGTREWNCTIKDRT